MPPVEEDRLPATMLERFVGSSLTEHMIALLRFSHQNRRASAGSVTDIREAQNTRRRRSSPEGRHPHCHFRGLLRLYACYGPADRSATQGDLCHEASVPPVAQRNRSSASRPIDNYLGGTLLHLYERPGVKGPFGPPCARTTSHAAFSFPNSLVRPQADILPSRPAR